MKNIFLISTAVCTMTVAHGQTAFQKIYGNTGNMTFEESSDFVQTADGGYAIVGLNDSGLYFLKTNTIGDTLWTRTYPGSPGYTSAHSVRQTMDGGYIIAGNIYTSDYQALLIKTTSSGNISWSKQFGGTYDDVATSAEQTSDGGYIFTGYTSTNGGGDYDVFVVKTNSAGNILWSKTYGDTEWNLGDNIQQTSDGGYIIAGHSASSSNFLNDVVLIKINSSGNLTWVKKYGDTGTDFPQNVRQTSDGGYILVGFTNSFNTNGETFLLKTNSSGTTQWTKTYSVINGKMVYEINGGNNYIITGVSSSGAFLMKSNNIGDTVWTKSYNIPPTSFTRGWSVKHTTDGGFAFCGNIWIPGDTSSIYLVKTDSNGNGVCYRSVPNYNVLSASFTTSTPTYITSSLNTNSAFPLQTITYVVNVSTPCVTGINEIEKNNSLTIFPNPISAQTTLQTENPLHNATLTVDNCFGQTVAQIKNISGQTVVLSRDNLASGLYFVRLTEENKTIAVDKLVIADK